VIARLIVFALAGLAVFVQLAVWGATKIRSNGALLDSWQPYFGWPYGLALAGSLVAVCRVARIDRGVTWLVRTWVIAGVLLMLVWLAAGRSSALTADDGVALVAGLGALVLAVGLRENHLAAGT
jgi:hypothetical protein